MRPHPFSVSWFHLWLHWVLCSNRPVCACNVCDLRWSGIEQHFSLRFCVGFHNSYQCFWWMHVVYHSRFVLGRFHEIGQWLLKWVHSWEEACLSSSAITALPRSVLLLRRLTCNCSKILLVDVYFPLIRNFMKRQECWIDSLYGTVTLYCPDVWSSPCGSRQFSSLTLSDASDSASNHIAIWSYAPFGLFGHQRHHTLSCPNPQKQQWPNLNCFAYSVASVAFARHDCSLFFSSV